MSSASCSTHPILRQGKESRWIGVCDHSTHFILPFQGAGESLGAAWVSLPLPRYPFLPPPRQQGGRVHQVTPVDGLTQVALPPCLPSPSPYLGSRVAGSTRSPRSMQPPTLFLPSCLPSPSPYLGSRVAGSTRSPRSMASHRLPPSQNSCGEEIEGCKKGRVIIGRRQAVALTELLRRGGGREEEGEGLREG